MFILEVESLLEKTNKVISELMYTLLEDFGDVFYYCLITIKYMKNLG
jgi:hypothetical protein